MLGIAKQEVFECRIRRKCSRAEVEERCLQELMIVGCMMYIRFTKEVRNSNTCNERLQAIVQENL